MKKTDLTLGEVRAMYFDTTALQLPPVPLYRLDMKGGRHYFTLDAEGEPQFYAGVTTVTGATLPTPDQLTKWIADMGYENAKNYRDERAAYGTLMHTVFAHILINGSLDLATIDSITDQYVRRENLSVPVWQWADDLKQDVIAFAQWVADYDVKPLGIEVSLCDAELGIAGTVDLPCLITIPTEGEWGEVYASGPRKGEPKLTKKPVRYAAIVDFKSGRKSYAGDDYAAAQLQLYKALWHVNFETFRYIEGLGGPVRTFNWSPKDWRTNPGYNFTEQTEAYTLDRALKLVDLYKMGATPIAERTKTFYDGVIKLGAEPGDCYHIKSAPELAIERLADGDTPVDMWHYTTVDELISEAMEAAGAYALFEPKGKELG